MKENFDYYKHLVSKFSYNYFRPGQKEAIEFLMQGKDCLCIMPTGGGKSLIYQYIATLPDKGLVIVISPLISLMKDQVDSLNKFGIEAMYCNSSQNEVEQLQVISKAVQNKLKILYVSPEKILSKYFLEMILKMKIKLIAVDEAHCTSQWGHDFRPEYSSLYKIRKSIPYHFPIVALTATATKNVKLDIIESLLLENPKIIFDTFLRKNLNFNVEYFDTDSDKNTRLISILSENKNKRIILYCATRKKVDELNEFLKSNGIQSSKYHAGQSDKIRSKTQTSFSLGKIKVLIATNAFGMGIDHPDVRLVIHYQVPASIEAYYQEAGRAGRDGFTSECILFYKTSDFNIRRYLSLKSKDREDKAVLLEYIKNYCLTIECRQKIICNYFDEDIANCENCDNCKKTNNKGSKYISQEEQKKKIFLENSNHTFEGIEVDIIKSIISDFPKKYGKKLFISTLRGRKSNEITRRGLEKSKYFNKLNHIPEESLQKKIDQLVEEGEILVTVGKYNKLYLKNFIPIKKNSKIVPKPQLSLQKDIRNFRDREARRLKWKKYMVLQNIVISRIVTQKPKSIEDLLLIKGIGQEKVNKFGNQILSIIKKYE